MNYRKKNYRGKRGYSGRPHRRTADSYHQPLPPEQSRIPYARHTLTKPDVEAVVDALLSGTLTNGRELERFESLLAKLTHSEYAIAFNSGTAAIHSALACLKLEPEDEVILPSLTFCAVANMVRLVGARVVLVDCDPDTRTLSVDAARAAITENTKAIFTNNFGGHPSDLLALRELCDENNLLLLEDACHGLGGKYRGHYVGNQADLTTFSFHPSKAITTCEGGAVTTNNRAIAEWMRQFRQHGIQKDSRYFTTDEKLPDYYQELQFSGMNYRMSEIHAALGRSQLTRLDRHIDRRRALAQVYQQKLGGIPQIKLPFVAEWADSAFHLYPVEFIGALEGRRDEIYRELKAAGIDAQVHYVPLHRMPLFAAEWKGHKFPNTDAYFSRCLSLPLYCDLSFKDLERITDLIVKLVHRFLGDERPEEVEEDENVMIDVREAEVFDDGDAWVSEDDGDGDDHDEDGDDDDDLDEDEGEAFLGDEMPRGLHDPSIYFEGGEGLIVDAPPPPAELGRGRLVNKAEVRPQPATKPAVVAERAPEAPAAEVGEDDEDAPKSRGRRVRAAVKKDESEEAQPARGRGRKPKEEADEAKPKAPRRRTPRSKKDSDSESEGEA